MKKIALIDCRRTKGNVAKRTSVNFRNMLVLENTLDAVGIYDPTMFRTTDQFDAMVFGFGSNSNDFIKTTELIKNNPNAVLFWMVGEYEQSNYWAILNANRKFHVIKNFVGRGKIAKYNTHVLSDNMINLNLLITRKPNEITIKKHDVIYYSRWRKNRSKYAKLYLQNDVHFSSDSKNFKQYKHIGCNPIWIQKLSWIEKCETLNLFRFSLYMEDEFTHTCFNNLANRWYEAGICNCIVLFDRNCINTIKQSEIGQYMHEIEPFLVDDHQSMMNTIEMMKPDWNKWLDIQRNWRKNELQLRQNMLDEFKQLIEQKTNTNEHN